MLLLDILADNPVVILVPAPDDLKNMSGYALAFRQNSHGETRHGFPPAKEGFETCMRWKVVSEESMASKLTWQEW